MRRLNKKNAIKIGITVGILLLLLFIISRFGHVIIGPRIVLDDVPKDAITTPLLTLTGKIKGGRLLWINSSQVPVDQNGLFTAQLVVPPGYTIITLEAQDELGARRRRKIPVYYVAPLEPPPIEESPTSTIADEPVINEQP